MMHKKLKNSILTASQLWENVPLVKFYCSKFNPIAEKNYKNSQFFFFYTIPVEIF